MSARSEADRVARIVAALIARNTIEASRKDIDNLTFSFIAPLDSNNGEIFCHRNVYPQGSSISSRSFGTSG